MFIKGTSDTSSHPKLHTYEEGYLLPVLTGDQLLFSHRHKGLLRLLRDLAECETDDFDRSYALVLSNFMEFVQVLPHKSNGILGSLLNYSLARAVAAFQKYCQMRKGQTTPLHKFALFSAALLKDIGRVITNQRIVLVNEAGEYQSDWNPFSGSMIGQSDFYKMYQLPMNYLGIERDITPLLARQLIPRDMFLWLSSDLTVFADWLSALLGEEGARSKELTIFLAMIKREDILTILNSLDGAEVNQQPSTATEYGESFYQWLKEGLENGEIDVNTDDAGVQILSEGVLVEKKLFKQFADLSNLPVNFVVVYQQFGNLMGIVSKGGNDFLNRQYFSSSEASGGARYGSFSGGGMTHRAATAHEGMIVNKEAIFIHKEVTAMAALKTAQSSTPASHQYPQQTNEVTLLRRPGNTEG